MAANRNTHVNVKQHHTKPGNMDGQRGIVQQPEALPHTVMQQDISQVPLLLHWPTVIVPLNYVPANLNPQMTITFSWNPDQPVTIPCAISNMILEPCICSVPLVVPSGVMGPDNANQTNDVLSTHTNDVTNQRLEVNTQLPGTSNQGLDTHTQLPDVSNHGALSAEVNRQKVLDAAEALLILRNSPQAWRETSSIPVFGPTAEGQYPEVKKSRRPPRRQVLSREQAANKVEEIGPGGLDPSPPWCPSLCLPEKAWEEMHRGPDGE